MLHYHGNAHTADSSQRSVLEDLLDTTISSAKIVHDGLESSRCPQGGEGDRRREVST